MAQKSSKPGTILQLVHRLESIPLGTTWSLSAINEFKGKQELYQKQSPGKLKHLKEHALIESSVSSNRMEGVQVEPSRIQTVIFGNSLLKDRDEEEVRGYQQALRWVHENHDKIKISEKTILRIHKLCKGKVWDAGKYKEKQIDITEKYPDGRERIRFKPPTPKRSEKLIAQIIKDWHEQVREKRLPPLILLAAFNLDFLCIHPFRDGNGRVSRVLLLLQLYHIGFFVGKYISIEKIIEENKARYYETLESSSANWHEGNNSIWPFGNYLLFILKEAFEQLDLRISNLPETKGNKTELIKDFINESRSTFSVSDIKYHCPGVSIELIRKVLKDLQKEGLIQSTGRGRNARWERLSAN